MSLPTRRWHQTPSRSAQRRQYSETNQRHPDVNEDDEPPDALRQSERFDDVEIAGVSWRYRSTCITNEGDFGQLRAGGRAGLSLPAYRPRRVPVPMKASPGFRLSTPGRCRTVGELSVRTGAQLIGPLLFTAPRIRRSPSGAATMRPLFACVRGDSARAAAFRDTRLPCSVSYSLARVRQVDLPRRWLTYRPPRVPIQVKSLCISIPRYIRSSLWRMTSAKRAVETKRVPSMSIRC
jgi:hypothetical protein